MDEGSSLMNSFQQANAEASTSNLKRNRDELELQNHLQQQQQQQQQRVRGRSSRSPTSIVISPNHNNDNNTHQDWLGVVGESLFEEQDEGGEEPDEEPEITTGPSGVNKVKPRAKRRAVRVIAEGDVIKTDKSCSKCRIRKVRCDRNFPICSHCFGRGEECNLHLYPPKQKSKDLSIAERERLELLEERLGHLDRLEDVSTNTGTSTSTLSSLPTPIPVPPLAIKLEPLLPEDTPVGGGGGEALSGEAYNFMSDLQEFNIPDGEGMITHSDIGANSLDWRLATPQMATSLSQHLCNAFFDSCCSLLPTFNYFSARANHYRGDLSQLSGPAKVAVAAFCAIGARPSPHSALLGIDSFSSSAASNSKGKQPASSGGTLFQSAGTRRQNACDTLTREAHTLGFETGLLEDATQENLGAILALIQLMMFMELEPRRSRSLIRAAVGHYKDLHDACINEVEALELKRTFAFAIYYADSLTSAWARKSCMVAESDLELYFDNIGIIVPNLPTDEILPVLESLLEPTTGATPTTPTSILLGLRTAVHLLMCWTAKIQRLFTTFANSPSMPVTKLMAKITALWTAIDQTRIGLQYLQAKVYSSADILSTSPHSHSHSHSHSASSHSHETDFVARSIRSDRDLLDVVTLIHVLLMKRKEENGIKELLVESTSRVRRGLRVLAFYSKLYASGADIHMIYHHVFQLEHLPNWTQMALERFGDVNGPTCKEEEVSDVELNWFREGLHSACFFTPFPERRLAELRSYFESVDESTESSPQFPMLLTPPITLSPETDLFQFSMPMSMNHSHSGSANASGSTTPTNGFASLFADGLSRNWDGGAMEFY